VSKKNSWNSIESYLNSLHLTGKIPLLIPNFLDIDPDPSKHVTVTNHVNLYGNTAVFTQFKQHIIIQDIKRICPKIGDRQILERYTIKDTIKKEPFDSIIRIYKPISLFHDENELIFGPSKVKLISTGINKNKN
jgi:hypothetical protein